MTEERKEAIQRRLMLARYPRRKAAVFDDSNDHNPLVLAACAVCKGSGRHYSSNENGEHILGDCPACEGTGTTGEVEPYYPDAIARRPELPALRDAEGWVTCPACDHRFATYDTASWSGRRHIRCGQKLAFLE